MTNINSEKPRASLHYQRSAYLDYKLSISQNYINILVLVSGLGNLFLLVPDLALIESVPTRIIITIVRIVYSAMLFVVGFRIKSIRTFRAFSIVLSLCEALAMAIFLFVFSRYSQPNFLIQTMGVITIIIITFLLPNRWLYMLIIAVSGSIGFFVCSSIYIDTLDKTEYMAAVTYVMIAIFLCALSSRNAERHQFREFTAKTELECLSTTDFLTNTANRYKLKEDAEKWMAFCRRQALPLSLVFFDIDNMKSINDRYGHSTGDFVLTTLAKLVKTQLRGSDSLARWGGDEFVILLPSVTLVNAEALTNRIGNRIQEYPFIDDFCVTCSFGVVEMKSYSDFETMVSEADKLMYDSKRQGKNCVQCSK